MGRLQPNRLDMTRIDFKQPHVMAEIGCNHMGEFETAKELLTLAKEAGASVGKFQKRCPKELLTPEQYAAPHPNPRNAYGDTYGAHREYLELTVDQHRELKKTLRGTRVGGVSPCPCTLCVDRRVCVGLVCATRLFLSPILSASPRDLSVRPVPRTSDSKVRYRGLHIT